MAKSRRSFRLADVASEWWRLDVFDSLGDSELPLALNYEYARSCKSFIRPIILYRCGLRVQLLPVHHFFINHIPEFPAKAYLEIDPKRRIQLAKQLGFVGDKNAPFLPPPVFRIHPTDMVAELNDGGHPLGLDKDSRNFLHLYVDWEHADDRTIEKRVRFQVKEYLQERKQQAEREIAWAESEYMLVDGDIINLAALATAIKNGDRPIEERILNFLGKEGRHHLTVWRESEAVPAELVRSLMRALNSLIVNRTAVRQESESEGIQLRASTRRLLQNLDTLDLRAIRRLNRVFLEDVYSDHMHRLADRLGKQPRDRRGRRMNSRDIKAALRELGALRLLHEADGCESRLIKEFKEEEDDDDTQDVHYYALNRNMWERPASKAAKRLKQLWKQWCVDSVPFAFFPTLDSEDLSHRPAGNTPVPNLYLVPSDDALRESIMRGKELEEMVELANWMENQIKQVRKLESVLKLSPYADHLSHELVADHECSNLLDSPPTDLKLRLSLLEEVAGRAEGLRKEVDSLPDVKGENDTDSDHLNAQVFRENIENLRVKVGELASFLAKQITSLSFAIREKGAEQA